MTTVEEAHLFDVYCEGKSSRQLYHLSCERLGVLFNKALLAELSAKENDFSLKEFTVGDGNYVGRAGVPALIDVIKANKLLIKVGLVDQGVDDDSIEEMVAVLRDHERLEEVDLRNNKNITDDSGKALIQLFRENRMLCRMRVEGTSLSQCVQRKLAKMGEANANIESDFFHGDTLMLKRLFMELDQDGSGSITYGEILAQMELPRIAEVLERKMAAIDDTDAALRHDGELQIDEFLYFIKGNYKRMQVLEALMAHEDHTEENIVENWRLLSDKFDKARIDFSSYHKVRVSYGVLNEEQLDTIVAKSLEHEWRSDREHSTRPDGFVIIHPNSVLAAVRDVVGVFEEEQRLHAQEVWQSNVTPAVARALHAVFLTCSFNTSTGLGATHNQNQLPVAEASALFRAGLKTHTVSLQPAMIEKMLVKHGLDRTVQLTFPQWYAVINENFDHVIYNTFRPPWKAEEETSTPIPSVHQSPAK